MNIFCDTETTGFNPGQICELSFIVEDDSKVKCAKNYFFKVKAVESGAQEAHGFSKEMLDELSGGKEFKDCYNEFLEYFQNGTFVAHNAPFDIKFMSSELWRVGISYHPRAQQCTMRFFKDILKIPATGGALRYGPYKNPKLEEVVSYFNANPEKIVQYSKSLFGGNDITYHDSRFDTTAMYVVTNLYREQVAGGTDWAKLFCN